MMGLGAMLSLIGPIARGVFKPIGAIVARHPVKFALVAFFIVFYEGVPFIIDGRVDRVREAERAECERRAELSREAAGTIDKGADDAAGRGLEEQLAAARARAERDRTSAEAERGRVATLSAQLRQCRAATDDDLRGLSE